MDPIKLMIVEDDKITLDYLARMGVWDKLGIEVAATAINGKQGLTKYQECSPNLVLSDVEMPFLNGLEMFRAIRRDDPNVILLVISSYSEFSYVKEAMELGAWTYLLKSELSEEAVEKTMAPVAAKIRQMIASAESAILKELQTMLLEEADLHRTLAVMEQSFRVLCTHGGAGTILRLKNRIDHALEKISQKLSRSHLFAPCPAENLQQMQQWTLAQVRLTFDLKEQALPEELSPAVLNCLTYIRQSYTNPDLSINEIARHVFVSPNWLSAKFKSEIGCTINEYITQIRIDKAKILLTSGQYKIYEVAEMVGYGSSRYFSRVFSKLTNQSPQNYRGD